MAIVILLLLVANTGAYSDNANQSDKYQITLGGCTLGSLGPAYNSSICTSNGTYRKIIQ